MRFLLSAALLSVSPCRPLVRRLRHPLRMDARRAASAMPADTPPGPWHDLRVSPAELRPGLTLTTGQCFNWEPRRAAEGGGGGARDAAEEPAREWVGVLGNQLVLYL